MHLFTSSEVCEELQISLPTLRDWERRHVLVPQRDPVSRWRGYDPIEVERLKQQLVPEGRRRPGQPVLMAG